MKANKTSNAFLDALRKLKPPVFPTIVITKPTGRAKEKIDAALAQIFK